MQVHLRSRDGPDNPSCLSQGAGRYAAPLFLIHLAAAHHGHTVHYPGEITRRSLHELRPMSWLHIFPAQDDASALQWQNLGLRDKAVAPLKSIAVTEDKFWTLRALTAKLMADCCSTTEGHGESLTSVQKSPHTRDKLANFPLSSLSKPLITIVTPCEWNSCCIKQASHLKVMQEEAAPHLQGI